MYCVLVCSLSIGINGVVTMTNNSLECAPSKDLMMILLLSTIGLKIFVI